MIKVAVIGLGRIGWEFEKDPLRGKPHSHIGAYLACPKTELVAVADTNKSKLEAFNQEHPEISTYTDYEAMLNREKPDIISICTPTETHCRIARNCARFASTKVLWVEKPLASTVEESEKMIQTCNNFGTKLACNLIRRWDPAYRMVKNFVSGWTIKALCDKGMQAAKSVPMIEWGIGDVIAFAGRFSGGRAMAGTHMADLALWLSGKNTKISLLNVPTPYFLFEMDIIGLDGWIKIRNNGRDIQLWKPMESQYYAGFKELEHVATLDIKYDFSRAMLNAVEDLVECAQSEKQPECDGRRGLEALKLCHEVFKDGN